MSDSKQAFTELQRQQVKELRKQDYHHYKVVLEELQDCVSALMVHYSPNGRSYDDVDDQLKACLKQLTTSCILISCYATKCGFNLPLF